MQGTAQDRIGTGPFAALLILFSLLLGSANAAAVGGDLRGPASRLGASRQGAATALLPSGVRNPLDEEGPAGGNGPPPLPSAADIVTERFAARPSAEARRIEPGAIPHRPRAAYRARAPPAS